MSALNTPERQRRRKKIEKHRQEIKRRARLYDRESNDTISIGPEWEDFQDGPAEARIEPKYCTDEQSLVFFRVPPNTRFPLHSHRQAESVMVLSDGKHPIEEGPLVTMTMEEEGGMLEEFDLDVTDVLQIPPGQLHKADIDQMCVLLIAWTPGFPRDPKDENRILWMPEPE